MTSLFWSWQASPEKDQAVHTGASWATVPQPRTTGNERAGPRATGLRGHWHLNFI